MNSAFDFISREETFLSTLSLFILLNLPLPGMVLLYSILLTVDYGINISEFVNNCPVT